MHYESSPLNIDKNHENYRVENTNLQSHILGDSEKMYGIHGGIIGDELSQGFYRETTGNITEQRTHNDGESRDDNLAASLQELQYSDAPLSPGFMWQYTIKDDYYYQETKSNMLTETNNQLWEYSDESSI